MLGTEPYDGLACHPEESSNTTNIITSIKLRPSGPSSCRLDVQINLYPIPSSVRSSDLGHDELHMLLTATGQSKSVLKNSSSLICNDFSKILYSFNYSDCKLVL